MQDNATVSDSFQRHIETGPISVLKKKGAPDSAPEVTEKQTFRQRLSREGDSENLELLCDIFNRLYR